MAQDEQVIDPTAEQPNAPEAIPAPMEPVQREERVQVIDILRGFALFGILMVNMQFYTTPFGAMSQTHYWSGFHDVTATRMIRFLGEGKFFTMFSFLFGFGVAVQWERSLSRGRRFAWHHIRRMGGLLLFGLTHAFLIWMGDILVSYALLGVFLLLFLKRRPRTLLIWTGIFLLIPFVLLGLFLILFQTIPEMAAGMQKQISLLGQRIDQTVRAYSRGEYREVFMLRLRELSMAYQGLLFFQAHVTFAMFLVGLYVYRRGFFRDIPAHVPAFRKGLVWGLIVGLAGNLTYAIGREFSTFPPADASALIVSAAALIGTSALSCAYGCGLVLLSQKQGWQRRLSPLAAVGRMALTNYLAQSLICTTIFYSYSLAWPGFGLFAKIGPLAGIGLTLAIYVVQVSWSVWWLRHFRFGPMEWLWRSLTYGRLQPMRI